MTDAQRAHAEACAAAAASLAAVPADHRPEVLVGFDGFIDHIIDMVEIRTSPSAYSRFQTIAAFGAKVSAAAGKSCGIEAFKKQTRLGGNGPLMANGLIAQGQQVTLLGILGDGQVDPVFKDLAAKAKQTVLLGAAAVTDALEFDDGKVMLNFSSPMNGISFDSICARCGGIDGFRAMVRRANGIATVNWTQTPALTDIWKRCAKEIVPGLRSDRPLWFVDLADPHRRTPGDIKEGMKALSALQEHVDIVLGLNENECRQMGSVFGCAWPDKVQPEWEAARTSCEALRKTLGLSRVMCHLVKSSAVAWEGGSAAQDGFFDPKPKTTTGAGDHYNAGFFGALLAGIAPAQALQLGGATSGHYVRTGDSPTRAQVIAFLRQHAASGARG